MADKCTSGNPAFALYPGDRSSPACGEACLIQLQIPVYFSSQTSNISFLLSNLACWISAAVSSLMILCLFQITIILHIGWTLLSHRHPLFYNHLYAALKMCDSKNSLLVKRRSELIDQPIYMCYWGPIPNPILYSDFIVDENNLTLNYLWINLIIFKFSLKWKQE